MLRRSRSKSGANALPSYDHLENGNGASSLSIEEGYGVGYNPSTTPTTATSLDAGMLGVGISHGHGMEISPLLSSQAAPPPMTPSPLPVRRSRSGGGPTMLQQQNSSSSLSEGLQRRKAYHRRPSSTGGASHNGNGSGSGAGITLKSIFSLFLSPLFWACLMAASFAALAMHYRNEQRHVLEATNRSSLQEIPAVLEGLQSRVDAAKKESKSLRDGMREANTQRMQLQQQIRALEAEKQQWEQNKVSSSQSSSDAVILDEARLAAREEAWRSQVQLLQQATQRESKRAVMEKFGPGPHQVEFAIGIPSSTSNNSDGTVSVTLQPRYVVIEMAPLDVMPHAVHLFLEQVSHHLWDDAWFYINGPHVLQAGPQPGEQALQSAMQAALDAGKDAHDIDERAIALKPFRDLQLETLAFPEYADEFPHVPWTLGFTGRPGGPDFYINKVDNTISHGPGGQYQHDIGEFADPCFAKVIKGYATMAELSKLDTVTDDPEYLFFFEEPVRLLSATVLQRPIPDEQRETPDQALAFQPQNAQDSESVHQAQQVENQQQQKSQEEIHADRAQKLHNPHIQHQVDP